MTAKVAAAEGFRGPPSLKTVAPEAILSGDADLLKIDCDGCERALVAYREASERQAHESQGAPRGGEQGRMLVDRCYGISRLHVFSVDSRCTGRRCCCRVGGLRGQRRVAMLINLICANGMTQIDGTGTWRQPDRARARPDAPSRAA